MNASQTLSTSAIGPAAAGGGGRSREIADVVRGGFIAATLLLAWVHLDPFHDLTSVSNIEVSDGGSLATQCAFSLLGIAVASILYRLGFGRLRALATPALLLTAGWILVSIVFSVSPAVSLRRAILLGIAVVASATIMLVARSPRQFANILAGTALAVAVVCYVSLVIVPDLALHTALDLREPEHAGAWRGLFSHKNEAGAVMVVFVFIGLFALQVGNRVAGALLVALSAIFLAFTLSKTAIALLPLVLIETSLCRVVRGTAGRAILLLGPLLVILVVSLGSLFFPPVKDVVSTILPDVSFTGRTDIWEFTADHILQKPLTGWGYGAFWKTEATLYGGSEQLTWVNQADQAHNGYLDAALFMGLPGLALTCLIFVLRPFRDFVQASGRGPPDPSTLFFGRLWLFGLTAAAFESVFYDGNSSIFFMFMMSIFGLRYLAAHGIGRTA